MEQRHVSSSRLASPRLVYNVCRHASQQPDNRSALRCKQHGRHANCGNLLLSQRAKNVYLTPGATKPPTIHPHAYTTHRRSARQTTRRGAPHPMSYATNGCVTTCDMKQTHTKERKRVAHLACHFSVSTHDVSTHNPRHACDK